MLHRDQITREILRHLFNHLPWDRTGDILYQHAHFLYVHERHPGGDLLFNDVLHRIKSTSEILNPLRVFTTDKELVKVFVKSEVGDKYNVPTLHVLRSEEEISTFEFPKLSCIKPTHLSARVLFCDGIIKPNRQTMKQWLRTNYYRETREANYKELVPKIIIEPVLFNNTSITDYKVFCFEGRPRVIQVDKGRRETHTRNFYNSDWDEIGVTLVHPRYDDDIKRPDSLDEMLGIAAQLSRRFNFVRIDFYSEGSQLYVGEITHCHGSASERFRSLDEEILFSQAIFA